MDDLALHIFPAWVMFHRAEDLPGVWVAHVLDFDVVTQGKSLEEAIGRANEAAGIVLEDDLQRGRDPMARRAPQSFWDELEKLLERGRACRVNEAVDGQAKLTSVAMQIYVQIWSANEAKSADSPVQIAWTPTELCA